MPAIAVHDTQVIDAPWDAGAQEAKLASPIAAGMYAWYDASASDKDNDGYPTAASGYKFPHHEVAADGRPGSANVRALRLGLSSLEVDIPEADQDGVRQHLQAHLDAFDENKPGSAAGGEGLMSLEEARELLLRPASTSRGVLWAAGIVGKYLALRPEVVAVLQAALASADAPSGMPGAPDDEEDQPCPGVIPLYGIITPFSSFFSMLFGGGSGLDVFRSRLDAAVNDPNVSHIVLDVDSPGGLVDHVPETAAAIRQAREVKPITAVANTTAASAAYWLAAQANEIVVTPSGEVGSIGVYQMHRDISAAQERMGIKTTLISAGKYKTDGNAYEPLSSSAAQDIQDKIDEIHGSFVDDVAAGRGVPAATVKANFGQGRTFLARGAVSAGLADRVGTLEQVVSALMPGATGDPQPPQPASTAPGAMSAADMALALELRPALT